MQKMPIHSLNNNIVNIISWIGTDGKLDDFRLGKVLCLSCKSLVRRVKISTSN